MVAKKRLKKELVSHLGARGGWGTGKYSLSKGKRVYQFCNAGEQTNCNFRDHNMETFPKGSFRKEIHISFLINIPHFIFWKLSHLNQTARKVYHKANVLR